MCVQADGIAMKGAQSKVKQPNKTNNLPPLDDLSRFYQNLNKGDTNENEMQLNLNDIDSDSDKDALNTFYLRLGQVKDHSDRERGNPLREETCCRHMGYSLRLTARVLLYAPSQTGQQSWSTGWNEKYRQR